MTEYPEFPLCFDEEGRDIELLEVTPTGTDELRLEETPVFRPDLSLGDVIRVKEIQGIYYYVHTVRKSDYRRAARLLSVEAAMSPELKELRTKVLSSGGRWETVFGGLVILHFPLEAAERLEAEFNKIARTYGV